MLCILVLILEIIKNGLNKSYTQTFHKRVQITFANVGIDVTGYDVPVICRSEKTLGVALHAFAMILQDHLHFMHTCLAVLLYGYIWLHHYLLHPI